MIGIGVQGPWVTEDNSSSILPSSRFLGSARASGVCGSCAVLSFLRGIAEGPGPVPGLRSLALFDLASMASFPLKRVSFRVFKLEFLSVRIAIVRDYPGEQTILPSP